MKRPLVILGAVTGVLCMLCFAFSLSRRPQMSPEATRALLDYYERLVARAHPSYEKGVNDALSTLMLLNLELELKGERKTFGEMNAIVCERLNVEPAANVTK